MACCLFRTKPLPEPMLANSQLDSWEQNSVKFKLEFYNFHIQENAFEIVVCQNGSHFGLGGGRLSLAGRIPRLIPVFCEFIVWTKFYHPSFHIVFNIILYSTVLYWLIDVLASTSFLTKKGHTWHPPPPPPHPPPPPTPTPMMMDHWRRESAGNWPSEDIVLTEKSRQVFCQVSMAINVYIYIHLSFQTCGPYYWHGLTLIPAWISNYLSNKV